MKIDAILTPAELPALARRDLRETVCVVFDILRATSTFVTALHHGARAIIPVCEIAEALAIKNSEFGIRNSEFILLGGERDGVKIRAAQTGGIDFDFGNSPREYTPEKVRGKIIVSTTTNGTRALRACAGAKMVLAASYLNLSETAGYIQQNHFADVLLVCAGTGENPASEDISAAGAMVELLSSIESKPPKISGNTHVAKAAFSVRKEHFPNALRDSQNGRRLLVIPELRDDVAFCSQRDVFPLVAKMEADGSIRVGRS